jgi:hypothetical protein
MFKRTIREVIDYTYLVPAEAVTKIWTKLESMDDHPEPSFELEAEFMPDTKVRLALLLRWDSPQEWSEWKFRWESEPGYDAVSIQDLVRVVTTDWFRDHVVIREHWWRHAVHIPRGARVTLMGDRGGIQMLFHWDAMGGTGHFSFMADINDPMDTSAFISMVVKAPDGEEHALLVRNL